METMLYTTILFVWLLAGASLAEALGNLFVEAGSAERFHKALHSVSLLLLAMCALMAVKHFIFGG